METVLKVTKLVWKLETCGKELDYPESIYQHRYELR